MRIARWNMAFGSCFLAALLAMPMWGADTTTERRTAMPGTLNYVEGQASIGDQTLDSKAVGNADLQNRQVLETGNGKAEILLTPGVYLRVGRNSSVKMISNSLTNTEVTVNQGEAMVEVDQLYHENNLRISQPGADTKLVKTGLYDFDASNGAVRVFDGKAIGTADDHNVTVKKNDELALNSPKLKAKGFDKDQVTKNDDLYRGSSLRSGIYPRLTSMRHRDITRTAGMVRAGGDQAGIGIRSSQATHSCRAAASSTTHLDGASIPR